MLCGGASPGTRAVVTRRTTVSLREKKAPRNSLAVAGWKAIGSGVWEVHSGSETIPSWATTAGRIIG